MTIDSWLDPFDDLGHALGAMRWLSLELWDGGWGSILVAIALLSLASACGSVLWGEVQRLKRASTLRPLVGILFTSALLLGAWLGAVEHGRARFVQAIFDAEKTDPNQRAREIAEVSSILIDASAVAATALLALGSSGLWLLWRGARPARWTTPIAGALLGSSTVSLAVLLRTGRLLMPFGSSVGGESLDPAEKARRLLETFEHAHQALESGRVGGMAILAIIAATATVSVRRSVFRPTRRDWQILVVLFGASLVLFGVTRRHRSDVTQPVNLAPEVLLFCPNRPTLLPPLRGVPIDAQGPTIEIVRQGARVDGMPVRDPAELERILRSKREIWTQLELPLPHPNLLIIAAPKTARTKDVLYWIDGLHEEPKLAALVVHPPDIWRSSVLGDLPVPPRCAAVSINMGPGDGEISWGEVVGR